MKIDSSPFLQSLLHQTQIHPLWNHPFLQHCKAKELTLSEVKILAVQMYKFSKEFNRILAGILAHCPDESAQRVILENLFDEMGQGDANLAHPELFRRFTRALGMDDETLANTATAPETQAMIATYLALPHQYGYVAALGAVCFASEGIVNALYRQLYAGIAGAATFSQDDLLFFDVHISVDDSHAANLAALIETRIQDDRAATEVNRAVLEAMDARSNFFDGIQRQISVSSEDMAQKRRVLAIV
ncbi:MAG TPA: iron-containing redox enzyme family protein [Leptolyngbya sp.]|jgi:pyrroloquinoline-quinone synthase|nr:iron-containing redox enzyme family protein [Leptolyngbya sp.]